MVVKEEDLTPELLVEKVQERLKAEVCLENGSFTIKNIEER